jgi:hypothetical protein
VVLVNGCTVGDLVEVISFSVSSVLNAIQNGSGTVSTTNLAGGSVTQAKLATGVAGTGPAFSAYPNATLSLSGGADTKVLFQTEDFDTNNNFASSRFTPTVAGYYQLSAMVRPNATNGEAGITIYKNGASFRGGSNVLVNSGNQYGTTVSALVYANGTTDYFEIYVYVTNSCTASASFQSTWFTGCMVRSA